ncbi:PREDICTED: coiled-coil domain-containing protein 33 [Apaloderma vittatum]|uniref:coiled-coil domain-containing protein 33 n=1 Tax=Apaloderma vittatum TaxID=57397 RepID=UPI0005212289|nr:PREDICTED: coiled-coil domain-containing protein 33 [Apaloderma vittatum]
MVSAAGSWAGSRIVMLHQDDVSLPAVDAVASILPRKQPSEEQRSQEIIEDHQEMEVSGYRLAMQRMAGDLLSLRQQVTSLEMENGHLPGDEDVALAIAATLKHKLAAGTAEMRRLKDRVQQLQNELIRKNDHEKDLVLLQQAHQQEKVTLRRCQEKVAKMKGLEETVRQQEKVIEAMEQVLQEKLSRVGRNAEKQVGEALSGEVYTALLAENHRLREELARHPHNLAPIALPPPALPLEETARRWGREKQELSTRLLERDHGFPYASNLPVISMAPRRRPQVLPPLP